MNPSRVSIIIPAAGRSERFGSRDKLVMAWGDTTVLGAVVSAASASGAAEVIVVGPEDSPSGDMSDSIAVGASRAARDAGGLLIWPADMPLIPPEAARAVMERGDEESTVRPRHNGVPGHPVFFGALFRPRLEALQGPPRHLLEGVRWVDWPDGSVTSDIDTPEDYRRLRHA